jgi:uncharacterized protein YdeI (YjbR/CyaY-like superfamily)
VPKAVPLCTNNCKLNNELIKVKGWHHSLHQSSYMELPDPNNSFYAKDRQAWRSWLQKHHQQQTSVWLLMYHKKSATPSVYYDEAVEEALCFGWIDSKPNKKDGESYYLYFSRRKSKSNWSALNKERVKRLTAEGKMTPAGLEMVTLAKATGTWNALEKSDSLELPDDLKAALESNKQAKAHFEAFPPSAKRAILEWIQAAKRMETRQKRIMDTVNKAAENVRANQ